MYISQENENNVSVYFSHMVFLYSVIKHVIYPAVLHCIDEVLRSHNT